jgi:hypothetical protein
LDSLVDAEDYEGLGQRQAEAIKRERTMREAANEVSGTIEGVLADHPEFRVLGVDKVEEIRQDTASKGGTVVDFMMALSAEKQNRAVGSAVEQATEKFGKEMDARFASHGLEKRERDKGPDEGVEQGAGAGTDSRTEDEILADPNTPTSVLSDILEKRGIQIPR